MYGQTQYNRQNSYNMRVIDRKKIQKIMDPRNIGLYIFAIIILAITWSGMKTIQSNYQLQKQIATLKQQNAILDLENQNSALQNQYLQTDQYLDLAARQDLGLAAPGEQIMLISHQVTLKYYDEALAPKTTTSPSSADTRSKYIKNLEDWRDLLLGRNINSN